MRAIRRVRPPTSWSTYGGGALIVLLSLTLASIISGCTSSAGSPGTPSGWRNFVVVVDKAYPTPITSIDEMERIGGFPFVFPSYLPEGMDNKLVLDAWVKTTYSSTTGGRYEGGPGEKVRICESDPGAGCMFFVERMKPLPENFPQSSGDVTHTNIGNTDVACSVGPLSEDRNPVMQCDWLVGEKGFSTYFEWTLDHAISGYITEDMRQEGMKVVESMIVAPEHP